MAKAKAKTKGIQCMNNSRQLMLAWRLYADDNSDYIPASGGGQAAPEWDGGGWLDFTANKPDNYDFNQNVKKSPIWKYCGNSTAIWHCPADRATTTVNGKAMPRVPGRRTARAQFQNHN